MQNRIDVSRATLHEFARVNDAAAATTKKLQKYAILAAYFRTLADDDLRLAVRFAAGRTFAGTDERVLAVGGAIVSDVILRLLRVDPQEYHDVVVASGEIGEALSKLWDRRPPLVPSRQSLTLHDLCSAFEQLAVTGNVQRKSEILTDRFSRCVDPREAAYLAKIIFGDLRTGVQEGVLHYAIAEAFARDGKDVQRAQLLIGDLGEVAVLAKHDRLATAQFKLFHPIQFMLAVPQETADDAAKTMDGRTFFAEDKLDGIRAQVHKQGDGADARVAIYTRTMDRTDESFPDVVNAIRKLPGDFLLDGEIVPYRDGAVLPFAHIQKRLGRKVLTPKILRDNPAAFIAFDILFRDGDLLMDRPLRERRVALDALGDLLVTKVTPVMTAEEIDLAFCNARDCRNEGLILKDPASLYTPGRRGQAWLKLKTHLPTFDCVVTFAETGHGKRRNSLSDYTFAVWDRDPSDPGAQLVNVGKAYSGVTDAEIAQLTELFTNSTVEQWGRVRQVVPKVVLEIACDQIQKSERHASGYALRFPRIKRVRWDKPFEQADRLSRVIEVYESAANFGRSDLPTEPEAQPEPTLFDGM
ncbi:MAG: ligase 1 [Phycisphaerales bacterium]|nr:ligase 1 [Phycisphaerales bacterium]